MSITKLVYRIAKDYGITALAEDCGINLNTFKNKVNPNIDTHHLNVEELDLIATMANTDEIAEYFAEQRGMMCIKKINFDDVSDQSMNDLSLMIDEKKGEYSKEIRLSLSDGDASFDEAVEVKKKFDAMVASIHEYQNKYNSFMAWCEERRANRK